MIKYRYSNLQRMSTIFTWGNQQWMQNTMKKWWLSMEKKKVIKGHCQISAGGDKYQLIWILSEWEVVGPFDKEVEPWIMTRIFFWLCLKDLRLCMFQESKRAFPHQGGLSEMAFITKTTTSSDYDRFNKLFPLIIRKLLYTLIAFLNLLLSLIVKKNVEAEQSIENIK